MHGHALQLIGRALYGIEQGDGLAVGDRNDEIGAGADVTNQRVGTRGMPATEEVVNIHFSIISRDRESATKFHRDGNADNGFYLLTQGVDDHFSTHKCLG